MFYNMYEIFDMIEAAKTFEERVNILRKHRTPTLEGVLRGAMDPRVKWIIKEVPRFNKNDDPVGLSDENMSGAFRKFYLFEEGNIHVDRNLSLQRKYKLFIDLLETLEAREADILVNMTQKNLKVRGLTPDLVNIAFPGVLPKILKNIEPSVVPPIAVQEEKKGRGRPRKNING